MKFKSFIVITSIFLIGIIHSDDTLNQTTDHLSQPGKQHLLDNYGILINNATVKELKKRFKGKKPALFIDCHDVFAKRDDQKGRARFMQNTLPTISDKVLFGIRLAGAIMNPLVIGNIIWLGMTDKEGDAPTEKRKVAENYHYFIKKWWSEKFYQQIIQYSTDIYEPNEEMIAILYELKNVGCEIYLFSNGGYDTIKAIQNDERFKKYFEEGPDKLFSNTPEDNENFNSINNTYRTEYLHAKPSPSAFEQARKKYRVEVEYAIMVDDSFKKLPHPSNHKLKKRYPKFNNFWACSIQYDPKDHNKFEQAIKILGLLQKYSNDKTEIITEAK